MREIKLTINLVNGYAQAETDIIRGELDSIIIKPLVHAKSKTKINIISSLGYLIFTYAEIDSITYIPIRIQPLDKEGHRINFEAEKFKLNERLLIEAFGPSEIGALNDTEIIIRYD